MAGYSDKGFGGDFFRTILDDSSSVIRDVFGGTPQVGASQTKTFPTTFGGPQHDPVQLYPHSFGQGFDSDPFQLFMGPASGFQTQGMRGGIATARQAAMGQTAQQAAKPDAIKGPIARARERAVQQEARTGDTNELRVNQQSPFYSRALQIAQEEGIDGNIFTRLVAQESDYNPEAVSPMGALGLTQLMPGTAQQLGVTNPRDPEQALRGGARYLKQQLDRYGGDYVKALAAYNAGPGNVDKYGGVPPFQETQTYVRRILGNGAPQPAVRPEQPTEAGAIVPEPPRGTRPLKGITVAQYGSESLATGAADYICGPIAAKALVAANGGREPTLQQSLDMARQLGIIDPDNGMHGIESTANLIRKLGGKATIGNVDFNTIRTEIDAGRPVLINTPGHYFVVEGYDTMTGRLDLGNTATSLRASGGNSYYTLDEIQRLGFGAPRGAIYAR